jgi:hypothetical protein
LKDLGCGFYASDQRRQLATIEGERNPSHVQVGTSHSQTRLLVEFSGVKALGWTESRDVTGDGKVNVRSRGPKPVRSSASDEGVWNKR